MNLCQDKAEIHIQHMGGGALTRGCERGIIDTPHDTTGRLHRSPVFLVAIRRPVTRRSDACFLRT